MSKLKPGGEIIDTSPEGLRAREDGFHHTLGHVLLGSETAGLLTNVLVHNQPPTTDQSRRAAAAIIHVGLQAAQTEPVLRDGLHNPKVIVEEAPEPSPLPDRGPSERLARMIGLNEHAEASLHGVPFDGPYGAHMEGVIGNAIEALEPVSQA